MSTIDKREKLVGWMILVLIIGLCTPLLALQPQSGDGAEMVKVGAEGGVLHPPGFPSQVWFMKLFAHVFASISDLEPLQSSTLALSFLSMILFSFSLFFLERALLIFGFSTATRVVSTLCYAFFPALWKMGVQPEVFAGSSLAMTFIFYCLARVTQDDDVVKNNYKKYYFGLPILGAIAYGLHPIATTQFVALGAAFVYLVKSKDGANRKSIAIDIGIGNLIFGVSIVLLYLTLFLSADPIWPNWGKIEGLKGLYRHAVRAEYGVFSLASADGTFNGLVTFLKDILKAWHAIALISLFGLWKFADAFWRNRKKESFEILKIKNAKIVFISWFASFALGVFFLHISNLGGFEVNALPTLERFQGTLLLPMTLFLAFGIELIFRDVSWFKEGQHREKLLFLLPLSAFIFTFPMANMRTNNTSEIFSKAMAVSLPNDAIYVGLSDIETTMGATYPDGRVKYPIKFGLLPTDWYIDKVVSVIEPRAKFYRRESIDALLKRTVKQGFRVAAIDKTKFDKAGLKSELIGLVFVAGTGSNQVISVNTLKAALNICKVIKDMGRLPSRGHVFSRTVRNVIARAYNGTAKYLEFVNKKDAAAAAKRIEKGIMSSADEREWIEGCRELKANF